MQGKWAGTKGRGNTKQADSKKKKKAVAQLQDLEPV